MSDFLLENAWRLHQSGNLTEAARLYNDIIRANPRHLGALQMLGFLHFQRGEFAVAERIMEKVLKLDPKSVDALYNRGCALQALERNRDALACFDRAIALKRDHAPALMNRGNTLAHMGRFEEALQSYDRALAHMPASADALLNRGNALAELGRFADALATYEKALNLNARDPVAWNNRGNALVELGRHEEALESFNRALTLDPGYADALENRANALAQLGRAEEAVPAYDKALQVEPGNAGALFGRAYQLRKLKRYPEALAGAERALALDPSRMDAAILKGNTLIDLRRLEDAVAAFDAALRLSPDNATAWSNRASALIRLKRGEDALAAADKAIALEPDHADAWHNRGSALGVLKRYPEAMACYDTAIAKRPENPATWVNRGNALIALRHFDDAATAFSRALAMDPQAPEAWDGRGNAFSNLKRFPEAVEDCEKALALDPDHVHALQVLIHSRINSCDWRALASERMRAHEGLQRGRQTVLPFDAMAISGSEADTLESARLWATEECPPSPMQLWRGERYRHDKIRVAYLSTDFRDHAVGYLIAGVFDHHDRERFETFGISFGQDDGRPHRARIMASFDRFVDARTMSDSQVAAMLRENEVDIAVDLNGYTGESRSSILAMRPAPVQVNYLGYPGTMAAPYMDYILADRVVLPEAQQAFFTERVVYLPDAYQANDSARVRPERIPTRAEAGLPDDGFVFCSFNTNYKIMPEIFDIWMRLLRDVRGSVLWLLDDNPHSVAGLKREAEARGISASRLVFAPRRHLDEHLARYPLADLFLDTLPYNAHTTASDALWTGVPIITRIGTAFPGRVAASLLTTQGLPELITETAQEYERRARDLASNPAALAAIREKILRNRETHPLFDTARMTRHLEAAYTGMWERQQRGEAPQGFGVAPIT